MLRWLEHGDLDDAVRDVGDRRLVIAGGDETIHACVNVLRRTGRHRDIVVGLLPVGTGNDTARGLGLSLDLEAATRTVIAGRPRSLAALFVERDGGSELVVNVPHLGLGAEASIRAEGAKSMLGRFAYPAGALLAGVRPDVPRARRGG